MRKTDSMRRKRGLAIAGTVLGLAIMVAICLIAGRPMVEFVSEPEKFREWVDRAGVWGRVAFVGMMAFQVVVAIIPGEPLEIGAGYAFGAIEGTVLCLVGALVGSVAVFLFVKKFGMRFVTLFISREKLDSIKFLKDEKRLHLVAYILFLIPGTPKDVMTYFVGLTPMKLSFWIFITLTARIPSVVTSTIGGDALGTQNYLFAIIVFIATGIISLLGVLIYRGISRHRERSAKLGEAVRDRTA